jgi:hypothetical protein
MNLLYLGNTFPTFRDQFWLLGFGNLWQSLESSGTAHQASQTHIPKVLNPQQRSYENLKPYSIKILKYNIRICMLCLCLCCVTGCLYDCTDHSFSGSPFSRDSEHWCVNFFNPLEEESVHHRLSTWTGHHEHSNSADIHSPKQWDLKDDPKVWAV